MENALDTFELEKLCELRAIEQVDHGEPVLEIRVGDASIEGTISECRDQAARLGLLGQIDDAFVSLARVTHGTIAGSGARLKELAAQVGEICESVERKRKGDQ
jgi:hypothetical protein